MLTFCKTFKVCVLWLFMLLATCALCSDIGHLIPYCVPSGCAREPHIKTLGNVQVMELSSEFSEDGSQRACWDFSVNEHMEQSAGIRLRLKCGNISCVRQLNVYVKCGSTWYASEFSPRGEGQWDDIVISKTAFLPEGGILNSWSKVEKIRIAAWRGMPGRFVMQVANLEVLSPNVGICLLRDISPDSKANYARHLGTCLAAHGVYPAVIDEVDCTTQILRKYNLVLLPYSEHMPSTIQNMVSAYLRQGGKAGVFYSQPKVLLENMKMPSGKFASAGKLGRVLSGVKLLGGGMSGGFKQQSPACVVVDDNVGGIRRYGVWVDEQGRSTDIPAIIGSSKGFWMTYVFLNQDSMNGFATLCDVMSQFVPDLWQLAQNARYRQALFICGNAHGANANTAKQEMQSAQSSRQNGRYRESWLHCEKAIEHLLDISETGMLRGKADEMRGVWMRLHRGLPGMNWGGTAKFLASRGVNALFCFMTSAYDSAYPSGIVANRERQSDSLNECLIACHENHIGLHVWMQCLNCENASSEVRSRYSREGRFQICEDGTEKPWLCPNQHKNLQLLVKIVQELTLKYPIDGLQFDMLRYLGSRSCYCRMCHSTFTKYIGHRVASWPHDVLAGGSEYQNWLQFRSDSIEKLLRQLGNVAKKNRPSIKISAAVMPDVRSAKSNYGQDWNAWIKSGAVDFVCTMDYRKSAEMLKSDIKSQLSQVGRGGQKIYPGIGLTVNSLSDNELKRQIQAVRQSGLPGFVIFECASPTFPVLK